MTFGELIKKLKKADFRLVRQGKGSVQYWSNGEVEVRVDFHAKKEVPSGTCHKILKDAGLK